MSALQRDPRGMRAGMYGSRLVRLGLLCCAGAFMVLFSLLTWKSDAMGNAGGWASQHLGPHGNSIMGIVFGLLFAVGSGYLLLRTIRQVRAERAAGLLPPR